MAGGITFFIIIFVPSTSKNNQFKINKLCMSVCLPHQRLAVLNRDFFIIF